MSDKKNERRLIEMAYLYCWGREGNSDLRDEFKRIYNSKEFLHLGTFSYSGNGKFKWTSTNTKEEN